MQPYKSVLVMSVLVGLLAGASQGETGPWTIVQLTDDDYPDGYPQVSGSNVVWQGWDGNDYEIFLYDGTTTIQLTDNDCADRPPRVSGSNVVWDGQGTPGGIHAFEIFLAFPDCNTNGIPDDTETNTDGDGLIDECDGCPGSDLSETIIIDGCDTGVANMMLGDGCTMAELIAECAEGALNHGAFVSCVAHLTNEWKRDGLISGQEKGRIQQCAAQADIPPDGLVAPASVAPPTHGSHGDALPVHQSSRQTSPSR